MPDPVERGAFRLATAYMRRDRDLRMRLYPSIATILVFAILPFFDRKFAGRTGPLLVLTFIGMQTTTAMATLKMSPQFAAADVFRYAPLRGTAPVFHGVRKAVMVGFVLPVFVVVVPILFFAIRARETLLMVLPVPAAVPTLSLLGGLAGDYLPFSLPPTVGRQGMTNVGLMIAGSLSSAVIAAVALLALRSGWFWPLLAGEVVGLMLLHAVLLKGIRARPLRALE
jgi:hypothetical protein